MRPSTLTTSSLLLLLVPLLSLAANAHPISNHNNLAARNPVDDSSLGKAAFKGAESYKRDGDDDKFGKGAFRDTAESYKRRTDVDVEDRSVPMGGHYGNLDYTKSNPFGGKRDALDLGSNNNEARALEDRFVDDGAAEEDATPTKPTTTTSGGKFGKGAWGGGGWDYVKRVLGFEGVGVEERGNKKKQGKAGWKNSGSDFKREVGVAVEERGENGAGGHERMERHECGGRGGEACL